MAKQRFTKKHIQLIKHLSTKQITHKMIASWVGCSRAHITKILNNKRWSEIPEPDFAKGEELFWRFMQKGDFE
jgi:hypothetical protein